MKNIKLVLAFVFIITLVNCEIFNNPVDPMARDYVGYPVTNETLVEYSIGNLGPAGGYIFYDDEADGVDDIPSFRFLEVAPSDISSLMEVWGTYENTVIGADGTAIGTGAQNTIDIIAGDISNENAAHACADYSTEYNGTTYDDWFLPSKDELNLIYYNLKINDIVGFANEGYWSSSENMGLEAWLQDFNNGDQYTYEKFRNRRVRPVRAFNNLSIEQFTITFNKNDGISGVAPESITQNFLDEVTIPAKGSLASGGLYFKGWDTQADGTGVRFFEGDKIILKSDLELYAIFGMFVVGDRGPSGGYIFYDDESDGVDNISEFRFLEVASNDIVGVPWGTTGSSVLGADGTAIGTGAQNTLDIIAGDVSTTNAAHACADYYVEYNDTTYDDWFLPSKDELNVLFDNLKTNSFVGFQNCYYWSSSESSPYSAWVQSGDYAQTIYKHLVTSTDFAYVRPVRAF